MSALPRHPKRRGEWAELQFMTRAAAKGFTVLRPWGDSAHYDFAIENGGRFKRIQVKVTSHRYEKGYSCRVSMPTKHGLRPYTEEDIDFLAGYVVPEDVWYIVPIAALADIKTFILLAPERPDNRYYRFMEAWHLLAPDAHETPAQVNAEQDGSNLF